VPEPLSVAVAQPPCVPHDVAANARAHAGAVRRAGARVVVFPELSLTGYELDAAAVDPADERLAPLTEACAETGVIALAGAPVAEPAGGRPTYIAVLAFDQGGASVAYRKMWLGEEEAVRFTPGPEPARIIVDGWRLGLAVCKDTGVPEHATDTARWASTPTWPGRSSTPMRPGSSTSGPAGSRLSTGSGWRWPASPGPPAAATTRPPGGPGSGPPTVPSSPGPGQVAGKPRPQPSINQIWKVCCRSPPYRWGPGQPRTSGRRCSRLGIEVRTWAVNDVSTSATATPG
jgi:carbon-nitrogen hydrolase